MKYVITSENMPVIFNEALKHDQVAKGLPGTIKSAGFLYVEKYTGEKFTCKPFGESTSLDIKSNPETDTPILERLFNDF